MLLTGVIIAAAILALMWLFFRVWANLTLEDLTNRHLESIVWADKNSQIDLLDVAAVTFFAYVFGMGSSKISPEDKEKLKPLVAEIQRINGLLEPYFQLKKLSSFCFWASTTLFFGEMIAIVLIFPVIVG